MRCLPSLTLVATVIATPAAMAASGADSGRASELERLVRQDCGSCHGLTLAGGLGPDIRPAALVGRAPETIATIVLDGVPGTAMPPWRPLISESDADWIALYLLDEVVP